MKSFLHVIATIGADILKGVEIAAPIVGAFVPAVGPILTEVAQIISALEAKGQEVNQAQLAAIINAVSTAQAVKQSAAA